MGVAVDADCELASSVARRNRVTWTQVCDGEELRGELARLFNAKATPSYYLIAPDGRLAAKRVEADALGEALERVLARFPGG